MEKKCSSLGFCSSEAQTRTRQQPINTEPAVPRTSPKLGELIQLLKAGHGQKSCLKTLTRKLGEEPRLQQFPNRAARNAVIYVLWANSEEKENTQKQTTKTKATKCLSVEQVWEALGWVHVSFLYQVHYNHLYANHYDLQMPFTGWSLVDALLYPRLEDPKGVAATEGS